VCSSRRPPPTSPGPVHRVFVLWPFVFELPTGAPRGHGDFFHVPCFCRTGCIRSSKEGLFATVFSCGIERVLPGPFLVSSDRGCTLYKSSYSADLPVSVLTFSSSQKTGLIFPGARIRIVPLLDLRYCNWCAEDSREMRGISFSV